jgi:hypothetical protein
MAKNREHFVNKDLEKCMVDFVWERMWFFCFYWCEFWRYEHLNEHTEFTILIQALAGVVAVHFIGFGPTVTSRHWLVPSLSHMNPLHTHPIPSWSIIIFSSHLSLGLPTGFFLEIFRPKFCVHLSSLVRATCPAHNNKKLWESFMTPPLQIFSHWLWWDLQ